MPFNWDTSDVTSTDKTEPNPRGNENVRPITVIKSHFPVSLREVFAGKVLLVLKQTKTKIF